MTPNADTLQISIDYIKESVNEIKADIKEMKTSYATKLELSEVKTELNDKIENLDKEFKEKLAPWNSIKNLVTSILIGVFISGIIYLFATHPASLIK